MTTLFHASTNKKMDVIKPKPTLSNDIYIGDYVFATPNKFLATMYLASKGVPTIMHHENEQPSIMIMAGEDEYTKNDIGGTIYTVPAESFTNTPQVGLEDSELVSTEEVVPISREVYGSSIEAMKSMGITVNFISKDRFNELSSKPI